MLRVIVKIFSFNLSLIAIAFLLSLSVKGQTNIKVIDKETNEVLPFCHICTENMVSKSKNYFSSDVNGQAQVEIRGKTIISISSIGYKTYIDTLIISEKDLTIKLEPGFYNINEVVVTGQYKAVPVDKSIYNIKLIDKSVIEKKAANDLSEILSKELNLKLDNDPSLGTSMKMQGVSGQNVKILVDGVPVIGRMDGNIDLSQINLENVDHIEIIEGPMSVVYGSNALAGVVNIITKENKYTKFDTGIDLYYESVGKYNVNGNIVHNKRNHTYALNAGRNFFDGFSTNDTARLMQFKPKEQYNSGLYYIYSFDDFYLKYKVDYFQERLLDRNEPFAPYFEKANDTWFHTRRLNNSVIIKKKLFKNHNMDLLVDHSYYDRIKLKYRKDLTNLESILTSNPEDHDTTSFNTIMARGVFSYYDDSTSVNYQLGFDLNHESGTGKRMKDGEETIGDYALFVSMQWKISRSMTIQPAIRTSYNTKYSAPVTPSLNLMYNGKNGNIRMSYARGFRAPSLKELYLYFYDSNHEIEGNENLKAENSHNFNISSGRKFNISGNPLSVRAKGFYNSINDMIDLVPVDPNNILRNRNENIGHFESVGGELAFTSEPFKFLLFEVGVSRIGRKDSSFDENKFIGSTEVNSSLSLKFMQNTASVSLFYKYSGKYPDYKYDTGGNIVIAIMDGYHNMDLSITKSFYYNSLKLSCGIKNIFDNTTISGNVASTGGSHGGDGSSSLVGWGRSFYFSVKYNITKY